jgi:hypothetical protein
MLRPYEIGRLERGCKGNAIVTCADSKKTALGRDQFYAVQGSDEFATDDDLFQVVATIQGFVIEKAKPKPFRKFAGLHRRYDIGVDHEKAF